MAKIGVIGVGKVGSTTAFALSRMPYAEEIILIDPNKENTLGVAMDIEQGCYFQTFADVKPGTYADIGSLDFLVITAGVKPQIEKGGTRLTGMEDAYRIVDDIAQHIREKDFRGTLVIASTWILPAMSLYWQSVWIFPENRFMVSCLANMATPPFRLSRQRLFPAKDFMTGWSGKARISPFFPALKTMSVKPVMR